MILDCTLRDSSYAVNFQFTAKDTRNICAGLEAAGIKMIEVGHGLGLGASSLKHGVAFETDKSYLEEAAAALKSAKFGAFFIPGIGTKADIKIAQEAGAGFIRIGNDITNIKAARGYVEYAKSLGLHVSLNLMKTYALPLPEFRRVAREIKTWDADCIYIVDSAGCMIPAQVKDYIRSIEGKAGFHGHNNLGLANANSLAALEAGAAYVDSTLHGMGRSAGNAQTEVLAHILGEADPFLLFDVCTKHIEPYMVTPQGLAAFDVIVGMSGFHTSHLPRFKKVMNRYDVDIRRLIMEVSKRDRVNPSDELIEETAQQMGGETV